MTCAGGVAANRLVFTSDLYPKVMNAMDRIPHVLQIGWKTKRFEKNKVREVSRVARRSKSFGFYKRLSLKVQGTTSVISEAEANRSEKPSDMANSQADYHSWRSGNCKSLMKYKRFRSQGSSRQHQSLSDFPDVKRFAWFARKNRLAIPIRLAILANDSLSDFAQIA